MHTDILIESDNLLALETLPDQSMDLVYADPPFLTGRDFVGFSDNPDVQKSENLASEHRQFAGLFHLLSPKQQQYAAHCIPRLEEIHRILSPSGALVWHCDFRTHYFIRLVLNAYFGHSAFRNEIVWHYNTQAVFDNVKHSFKNNCDVLLFYANRDHRFTPQFHPLSPKVFRARYPYKDSAGRRYRHCPDRNEKPTAMGAKYDTRDYGDPAKGVRIGTVWTDIPLAGQKERVGYPTQKPKALLQRIIRACSHTGDTVLDPYCGSGTTCVVAKQLGRHYIGIDANPEALFYTQQRLDAVRVAV